MNSSAEDLHASKKASEPEQALVYVQRLSKLYSVTRGLFHKPQLVHAVDNINLYIRRGETFGLVGESGCGKSTLGRCIIRLTESTIGRVTFDGKNLTTASPAELRSMRQRMQIVFQQPASSLNPYMTVQEIVGEGIDIFGLAKNTKVMNDMVNELYERVGLDPSLRTRYPHELSGGQSQRVAIARALAVKPDFIVLDEPTSLLDLSVQARLLNLLHDLQQELGLSLLFISHDLRVVQHVSHRIAVMYFGRVVELASSHDLMKHRYHPYSNALFAAIPVPNGRSRPTARPILKGEPPSALDPPPGCAFFSRCASAEKGLCDTKQPPLIELEKGRHHHVACWHPGEGSQD